MDFKPVVTKLEFIESQTRSKSFQETQGPCDTEDVTLMTCTNAGSIKFPLTSLHKSENVRCYKYIYKSNDLPVHYYAQKNSRKDPDVDMLLVLVNASSHPNVEMLLGLVNASSHPDVEMLLVLDNASSHPDVEMLLVLDNASCHPDVEMLLGLVNASSHPA